MDSHLVTIEVSIEGATYHRVEADSLPFDENRLERLNRQTMEGRCAVQEYVVVLDDFVEDFVGLFGLSIHHPTGGADVVGVFLGDELVDDKRLEEFEGHLLRQTTLVELELGTNDDNRTTRVVDTLSEEVLTEPSLLALQGIGERAECPTLTG